jgi:hypothetical protein
MTRRAIAPAALLLVLILALAFTARPLFGPGAPATAAATPEASGAGEARSITVSGHGAVAVTPDLAHATFGVATTGTNLAAAQGENAARMAAVLERLRGLGIAERDLQTSGYAVYPQYDKEGQPSGYQVVNGVRATVRDLASLGATIDAAVAAGANRVAGVAFDLANKGQALQRAREAAVADSLAKAQHYAALTGVALGAPLTIVESGGAAPPDTATRAVPAGAGPSTPIEAGEGTITVQVQISYAIR